MQRAFVLSSTKKPLMPCHHAEARELLRDRKAAVYRRISFMIIHKERSDGDLQSIALKLDPGSRTTGIAMVGEFKRGKRLIFAANLSHRGQAVKDALESRRSLRRSHRASKTRYRAPRFLNRTRPIGWLPGNALREFSLPMSFSSGGRTKFNRSKQGYPKDHWVDAACVGITGEKVYIAPFHKASIMRAESRGSRQKCLPDKYGFPRTAPKAQKRVFGFQTGDLVAAKVTKGKKAGSYQGCVAVRSTGNFNIKAQGAGCPRHKL
jgi:hypothetical protein